ECLERALPGSPRLVNLTLREEDVAATVSIESLERRRRILELGQGLIVLFLLQEDAGEAQPGHGLQRRILALLNEPLQLLAGGIKLALVGQGCGGHEHPSGGVAGLGKGLAQRGARRLYARDCLIAPL